MDTGILKLKKLRVLWLAAAAAAYVLLVAAAEVVTTSTNPVSGIASYVLLLGVLLVHATRVADTRERAFLLALMLVPLSRIVALGTPDDLIPSEWQHLMIGVPILTASIVALHSTGLSRRNIRLQLPAIRMWPATIVIATSGIVIGAAMEEYSILWSSDIAASFDARKVVIASAVFALIAAVTEEIVFRGIIQSAARQVLGSFAGVTCASALYSVLFIAHRADVGLEQVASDVAFAFGVGLYFGIAVEWTRTLVGVILAHALIAATLLIGIPLL